MPSDRSSQHRPRLSANGMLYGGLVGAVAGAVFRGGITCFNLSQGEVFGFLLALPSAGIGLLSGAVAGSFCRVWMGAGLGAFLSAGVFGLFMLPFAWVFSAFNAADKVGDVAWPFFLQKALAGALAGGIGGYAGLLTIRREQRQTDSPDVQSDDSRQT